MEEGKSFDIEPVLNKTENPPFGYYNPESDGKVYWVCNYDQEGVIISTFGYDDCGKKDRKINTLSSVGDAIKVRDELIKNGWRPLKAPEVSTKIAGEERPLNRKERRMLERQLGSHIKKMSALEGK